MVAVWAAAPQLQTRGIGEVATRNTHARARVEPGLL